jgi:CheY-like chemotaxis protein
LLEFRERRDAEPLPGQETVLVVEDDDAVRELTSLALERHGYKVLKATGGADALRQTDAGPQELDLLVTDVVMPEMDGRTVATALRARFPRLKTLFLSGYTDDEMIRRGILQTGEAFLQKPYTIAALARKVREILDRELR